MWAFWLDSALGACARSTYRNQASTHVFGYDFTNPTQPVVLNSGSSRAFAVAPAIEYNFNPKVGVIVGTRFIPSGRYTAVSITPVIAVNIVH
jgi:hypothetical protein